MASDAIALLIAGSKRYPLLSHHQATLLNIRKRGGDMHAREILINSNIRLAVHMANQHTRCGVEYEDVVGFALQGLVIAVDKWDHKKGKFSNYACWWIRQNIMAGIGNTSALIRKPISLFKHYRAIKRVYDEGLATDGGYKSYEVIAEASGERVDRVRDIVPFFKPPISLDYEYTQNDNDGTSLLDLIAAPEDTSDSDLDRRQAVEIALRDLNDRERDMIVKYFGLDGNDAMTLDQIGMIYGITRERVRQIKEIALRKMVRKHGRMLQDVV